MGESLIQPCPMGEEGYIDRKPFISERDYDKIRKRSPGKLRASSRGNTGGASVVRNDWA
jgi:hypothetical protein